MTSVRPGWVVPGGRLFGLRARVLLRVLLGRDDNEPDLDHVEGRLGDRYLLCSDGLTDMVDDPAIERALGAETIDMAATELVRLALEGGGYDNVTVVIGELVEGKPPKDQQVAEDVQQAFLDGLLHAVSEPDSRLRVVATLRAE